MAKQNDNIVPFDRSESRRWTRLDDYWPDGRISVDEVNRSRPGALSSYPVTRRPEKLNSGGRRGLFLPIFAVAVAAIVSLWGSGILDRSTSRLSATATTSRGLVFGLCSEGGLTNCVASGDSFYLGGKNVRIASIEAPQLYGAACPKEATLARKSAVRLQALLNSGELEFSKVDRALDSYGLLLRNVSVDGKDAGQAMVAAGLARRIGDLTRSWC